jgi:hypothetical protein
MCIGPHGASTCHPEFTRAPGWADRTRKNTGRRMCDRYRYRNRYRYRYTPFQSGHSIAITIAIPIASLLVRPAVAGNFSMVH